MNQLLERLNNNMKTKVENNPAAAEKSDFLSAYKALMESGEPINVKFVSVNSDGTHLATDDNNVNLRMLKEDMHLNTYQKRAGSMLGVNLTAVVKDIDEESNTVYFAMSRKKSTISATVVSEIRKDLARKRPVRIYGKVLEVFPAKGRALGNAWVRLLDQDVIGNIDVRDWAPYFVHNLEDVCIEGETYEFDVIGVYSTDKKTGNTIWKLSRRDIAADPWKMISEDDFAVGNVILIKAVEKPEGKSYFWGTSPLVPDISIMCNYNSKFRITNGAYYKCKIDKLDIPNRFFRVSPFEVCPISNEHSVDMKQLARQVSKEK